MRDNMTKVWKCGCDGSNSAVRADTIGQLTCPKCDQLIGPLTAEGRFVSDGAVHSRHREPMPDPWRREYDESQARWPNPMADYHTGRL